MVSISILSLIFYDIIPIGFFLPFYVLLLLSANKQEDYIRKRTYLRTYAIIGLILITITPIVYLIFGLIPYELLIRIVENIILFIPIIATIFFVIYASENREFFSLFLFLGTILLLVNESMNFINNLMF